MNSFSDFGLMPSLLKTLKERQIYKPTEIQSRAIPMMMGGMPVVAISETGSGKTLTYALPLMHLLKGLEDDKKPVTLENSPRAVVVVPTRELGDQVARVFKNFTHDTRLRVRAMLGGMTFEQSRRNVSGVFEVLIATPGRLVQVLEQDLIQLNDVRMLIFDEADQMMDKGFLADSKEIKRACPEEVRLSLFSATISERVQDLMNALFPDAEVIKSAGSGKTVASLITKSLTVMDGERWPLLEKVLKVHVTGGSLVFTNTREQCDKLAKQLEEAGYSVGVYRGEMDKNDRRQNLKKFRDEKLDILVATDLAGRGLDVEAIGRVINYHLPKQMENYLHRVGRTARAGKPGLVINLVTERDSRLMVQVEGRGAPPRNFRGPIKPKVQVQAAKPATKSASDKTKPASKTGKPLGRGKRPNQRKFVPKPKPKSMQAKP